MSKVIIVSDVDGIFRIKIDSWGSFLKEEYDTETYDEYLMKIYRFVQLFWIDIIKSNAYNLSFLF